MILKYMNLIEINALIPLLKKGKMLYYTTFSLKKVLLNWTVF